LEILEEILLIAEILRFLLDDKIFILEKTSSAEDFVELIRLNAREKLFA